jgi:feruloyl esterase
MPARFLISFGLAGTIGSLVGGHSAAIVAAQGACENLVSLALPHTSITSAAVVAEGPVGGGRAGGPAPIAVPARCVVKAVTKPSSDSEIGFEVWMPVSGWNGKYQQAGNGGWAGSIPTASLVAGVMRGYATAGTDDGHAGGPWADWAIGHPEKLVDFGHRAVLETSVAKAIVAAFYKPDPSKSYFLGCSDGGREALMEAQRYRRFPRHHRRRSDEQLDGPDDHGADHRACARRSQPSEASKLPAIQSSRANACDSSTPSRTASSKIPAPAGSIPPC